MVPLLGTLHGKPQKARSAISPKELAWQTTSTALAIRAVQRCHAAARRPVSSHDPKVDAAALALLDKLATPLSAALAKLATPLSAEPTLADLVRVWAQAVRVFNITAAELFAQEVLSGKRTYKAVRDVTVEQLKATEKLATQFNPRLTRKAVRMLFGVKLPRAVGQPDTPEEAEAPTLATLNTRTGPPARR